MEIGIDASRATVQQRTGTEAYAYFLIQALIPLVTKAGHQLRLYFNQPPSAGLFPLAPHVTQVIIPQRRLWSHVRLAQELARRPPDVFFTPAHVIPFTYRQTSVATVHDLGYHYFPEAHTAGQRLYLRWSTKHNGRRARRILADSQATQRDLSQLYGIDPAKVEVVYPGCDPQLQPVTDEKRLTAVAQQYAITPPYLLYLGTLQPRKNLVRLVEAYAASGVAHSLVLAGKPGWLAQPILKTIAQLPTAVRQNICLPGYIAEADKAALLSGATALLYPSLYEGFGFPLLEAQACATAVLAANTSSLPELAADSALLVDPLDIQAMAAGIRQLVANATLRQELVRQGLVNVRRFTWEATAVGVLAALEKAATKAW